MFKLLVVHVEEGFVVWQV